MPYVYVEFFDKDKTVKFTEQGFELFKELRPHYDYNNSGIWRFPENDGFIVYAHKKMTKIDPSKIKFEFPAILSGLMDFYKKVEAKKKYASYWNC